MALTPGDRLGPYEILSPLGKGGMGEVWKAHDPRLRRDVAVKTSTEHFSERFEREAHAIAALNHPNICQIYDVGPDYLVMEHIEGAPLKGPLPLDQALKYAAQICDALDAAHRKGIVHRDLKPANILMTKSGVKLLDFGLAKLNRLQTPLGQDEETVTRALTGKNEIVGTLYYMSPEQLQAAGGEPDTRSDIFSFGLVLYELLTGKRAMDGASPASVIAAIIERPAPSIADVAPAALDRALKRCLEKDPDNRWQTARDLKAELEWISAGPAEAKETAARSPSRSKWIWPAVTALSVLTAALALWAWTGRGAVAMEPTRLSVVLPANRPAVIPGAPSRSLSISRDGTRLVYISSASPRGSLQLRSLDSLEVRDLPGTEGARQPFFSPDGKWVAFFAGQDIRKISLSGGNPVTVAEKVTDNPTGWFGVWADDNMIVFGQNRLSRVSAEGGAVTALTTPDQARLERGHAFPSLTPSGKAVLFQVTDRGTAPGIDAVMLDSGKRSRVLDNARVPLALSSGHLVFQRSGEYFLAPFDAGKLAVTGPAVPLGEQIRLDNPISIVNSAEMAVSTNGVLAYLPAVDMKGTLGLVSRGGVFESLGLPPAILDRPRVSPDGRSIAYLEGTDSYVYDLARRSTVKITQSGKDQGLAWHADSRSLAIFSMRSNGGSGIWFRKPDGSEQVLVPLSAGISTLRNFTWSADGKRLAYTTQTNSVLHVWVQTVGENAPSEPFIKGTARSPKFSPDGRWLAYDSAESGRNEVYLQQYPSGERLDVSTGGGNSPVWRPDGKELYFHAAEDRATGKLMAVSVTPNGASLRLGKPVPLFDMTTTGPSGEAWQYAGGNNPGAGYDVLPDGRFVMVRTAAPADIREIVVVQNWFEELKRRLAGK